MSSFWFWDCVGPSPPAPSSSPAHSSQPDFSLRFGIELHGSPDPDPLPSAPTAVELPAWVGEPTDIDGVLQRYEAKITGRLAGTTLFVVQAKDRSGKTETCRFHSKVCGCLACIMNSQIRCCLHVFPLHAFPTPHPAKEQVEERQDFKLFLVSWPQEKSRPPAV